MGSSKPIEPDCDQAAEAARAQRMHRMLNVRLRSHRFGTVTAMARNVSPGGMGGSTRQWLGAGEDLEVELPNIGWVPASVAWTDGTRFGLTFAGEIDAARVTRDAAAGRDRAFEVMDRFRPDTSSRRPGLAVR